MYRWMDQWINGSMDVSINGWVDGWIVANFTKETRIKAWGEWSEEEQEEEQERGKWEDASSAVEFSVGHHGDGRYRGPV